MSGLGIRRHAIVGLSVSALLALTGCGAAHHQPPRPIAPSPGHPTAFAASGTTVPAGLVGERLTVADKQLGEAQLSSSYRPPVPAGDPLSDWGVCSTSPQAGLKVGDVVVLHLAHLKCGGGSDSPAATGSPPGSAAVEAAWHQVTEALARKDGAAFCAGVIAVIRRKTAASGGSSCQDVVRTMTGPLHHGDVRAVTKAVITSVGVQGQLATVYYKVTNGLSDLNVAAEGFNAGISFIGWSDMQQVDGQWLLVPLPA